jgi:hypothetical protein
MALTLGKLNNKESKQYKNKGGFTHGLVSLEVNLCNLNDREHGVGTEGQFTWGPSPNIYGGKSSTF